MWQSAVPNAEGRSSSMNILSGFKETICYSIFDILDKTKAVLTLLIWLFGCKLVKSDLLKLDG